MRRILTICCILMLTFSCGIEENPIPSVPVYLNLDLNLEDKELRPIPSYKEYGSRNINPGIGERAGFGGVLVVHNVFDEFKAFDRTCPYEATPSITVEVDNEVLYAVCPKCGTKYDIAGSGAPNGSSKHYLRQYSVTINGNRLIVRN